MATRDDLKALEVYRSLMIEAKARALSIGALANDQRGIPSPLVLEYGFLQIRMLCEIVALGCLVAHGDLVKKAPRRITDAFEPSKIITALEDLHDDFFPVPIDPQRAQVGWHMAEHAGGHYLTKSELRKLWGRCGDILHRGNLRKVLGEKNPVQNNFADLEQAAQKIMNLLSQHRVVRADRQIAFLTFLQDASVGGGVRVMLGEAS